MSYRTEEARRYEEGLAFATRRIDAFVSRHGVVQHRDIIDFVEAAMEDYLGYTEAAPSIRIPQAAIIFMLDNGTLRQVHSKPNGWWFERA